MSIKSKVFPHKTSPLREQLRKEHGVQSEPMRKAPTNRKSSNKTPYDVFLYKYDHLEDYIDSFNSQDLVYYFCKIARDAGYKYVVSNIAKARKPFVQLLENFSAREICGMIEFLYTSDQDYLDKNRLSPNLLGSSWVNTIYADFQLWVEDEYVPKSKKKHKKHEWSGSVNDHEVETKIGEW